MNLFTIEKNTKESAYYDFEETKEMNWKIRERLPTKLPRSMQYHKINIKEIFYKILTVFLQFYLHGQNLQVAFLF